MRLNKVQLLATYNARGAAGLIERVEVYARLSSQHSKSSDWFIDTLSRQFAGLDPADWWRPWRWLHAMGSARPPEDVGAAGFRPEFVDDDRPARHYIAFVMIGYYLPYFLGWIIMYGWEILGRIRYGTFSNKDVLLAKVGLKHGDMVRRRGPEIVADLIEQDLLIRNLDQIPNVSLYNKT